MPRQTAFFFVATYITPLVCLTLLVYGCSSPTYSSNRIDLSSYTEVTVRQFEVASDAAMPPEMNDRLCWAIADAIRDSKPSPFKTVRTGTPRGDKAELVVWGRVIKYKPGSQLGRFSICSRFHCGYKDRRNTRKCRQWRRCFYPRSGLGDFTRRICGRICQRRRHDFQFWYRHWARPCPRALRIVTKGNSKHDTRYANRP